MSVYRTIGPLVNFYKQEIFTYPLSNNFHLISLQNSNLSSRQSVVRSESVAQGLISFEAIGIINFEKHFLNSIADTIINN